MYGHNLHDSFSLTLPITITGMDGFMHKPFKLSTLLHVIEDISNRRKQVHQKCALLNYFDITISFDTLHTNTIQVLLQTSALSRGLPAAVPMLPSVIAVPTDNDMESNILNTVLGYENIEVTTNGDSKIGSINSAHSRIKLEPIATSDLFAVKKEQEGASPSVALSVSEFKAAKNEQKYGTDSSTVMASEIKSSNTKVHASN